MNHKKGEGIRLFVLVAEYMGGTNVTVPLMQLSAGLYQADTTSSRQADLYEKGSPQTKPANNIQLLQNTPNPFSTSTEFTYILPESGLVQMEIYNILGLPVAKLLHTKQYAGTHKTVWDASVVTPGIYSAKLRFIGDSGAVSIKSITINISR